MTKQFAIHELRERNGLTQNELASMLEISPKKLWSIEQDSSDISNVVLKKIMYLFQIDYGSLFLGKKCDLIAFNKKEVKKRFEQMKVSWFRGKEKQTWQKAN